MGISADMFVKTYKANCKAKDKTFEDFINKHITTHYVDFMTKSVHCDAIIKASSYIKDGEKEFIKINSATRFLFFVMKLIRLYTDIEFEDKDIVTTYDKLNEVGAINTLIAAIPESEYSEFSTLLDMKLGDLMDNEYSLTALFYNLKQSLSISDEVATSAFEEVVKKLTEEK